MDIQLPIVLIAKEHNNQQSRHDKPQMGLVFLDNNHINHKMYTYINYCGPSHSGKTTTLGMLIQRFKGIASFHLINQIVSKPINGNPPDYRIVFDITINNIKYVIAISTHGDNLENLLLNHIFFDEYAPKIMVTASHAHSSFEHNLFIDNYINNNIIADNETLPNRGAYNYIKIQSFKYNIKNSSQKQISINQRNQKNCDYIYNLIMTSLNI